MRNIIPTTADRDWTPAQLKMIAAGEAAERRDQAKESGASIVTALDNGYAVKLADCREREQRRIALIARLAADLIEATGYDLSEATEALELADHRAANGVSP